MTTTTHETATPETWQRYIAAFLDERYKWAERLITLVVGLHAEKAIPAHLVPAWNAAVRLYTGEDATEETRRAGAMLALYVLGDVPEICLGLAQALKHEIVVDGRPA